MKYSYRVLIDVQQIVKVYSKGLDFGVQRWQQLWCRERVHQKFWCLTVKLTRVSVPPFLLPPYEVWLFDFVSFSFHSRCSWWFHLVWVFQKGLDYEWGLLCKGISANWTWIFALDRIHQAIPAECMTALDCHRGSEQAHAHRAIQLFYFISIHLYINTIINNFY